ncbi:HAD family hydrolase [Neoactinobaculum massilliense]|uniref:HAD family hydrolase n=1 Tax=Neoactinobaculum massilliense TaxID=2364794 RepID=UPI000F528037|nr:HAD family hydrolase [Neoactinobaculum massilliense]
MTAVLWDIDGTLLYPAGPGDNLFLEVIREMGPVPDAPLPDRDGKTDAHISLDYLAWAGLSESLLPEFMERLNAVSAKFYRAHPRRVMPGIWAAVQLAAKLGATSVLLTGNTPVRAREKLTSSGLDLTAFDWNRSGFGAAEPDRNQLAREVAAHFPGEQLVVVGDTDRDAAAATAIEAAFVRVARPE